MILVYKAFYYQHYYKGKTGKLRFYEPKPGLFIAESPKVIQRAANAGYQPVSFLVQHKDLEKEGKELLQKFPGIPVYTADYEVLVKLKGFALTRGILCAMTRRDLPSVEDICKNARRIAILENVVNPTNIGAIFRSAAALHMDAVLLTPGCCDPLYRRATRVSMGSVFQIPWTYFHKKVSWPEAGMELLRSLGFKTVAMALRNDSISIDAPALQANGKVAIFEVKYSQSMKQLKKDCDKALALMKERKYAEDYKDRYKDIFCYGISFYKKECLVKMLES